MFSAVALLNLDFQARQHGKHRRVNILVGAGDVMPARLQHSCQRGHRGSTDSDQVIVHDLVDKTS